MAQQYVTIAELSRLGIPGDAYTGLTNTQINAALLAASQVADSYLRKRYALPLVEWGDDLRLAVAQLASMQIMTTRGFRPGAGSEDVVVDMKNDAREWLRLVSKGEVEIDCVDSTPELDEDGAQVKSDEPLNWRMTTGRGDDQ